MGYIYSRNTIQNRLMNSLFQIVQKVYIDDADRPDWYLECDLNWKTMHIHKWYKILTYTCTVMFACDTKHHKRIWALELSTDIHIVTLVLIKGTYFALV